MNLYYETATSNVVSQTELSKDIKLSVRAIEARYRNTMSYVVESKT